MYFRALNIHNIKIYAPEQGHFEEKPIMQSIGTLLHVACNGIEPNT